MHELAERILSVIQVLDPGLDCRVEEQESWWAVHLPAAPGSVYRFSVYVYDDGEPQIVATLVEGGAESSLWHWPFEEPAAGRESRFLHCLEEVLTSPTRIRQKRGLLFTTARCEARQPDRWVRMGPVVHEWRWGASPPSTRSRAAEYESGALIVD